jgi:DNA invertase Pin-like site-specific DNA recombinase
MQRAIIFVRGNDTERQRAICEAYAKRHGFYIKGVTEKLSQAYDRSFEIDVLITAGATRISRDKRNFDKIIEMFDDEGVTVIIAE